MSERSFSRLLRLLVVLLAAVPALAVVPGRVDLPFASVELVLYREAKLAAGLILAWIFLLAVHWTVGVPAGWRWLRSPPLALIVGLGVLSVASVAWALVPTVALYEIQQVIPYTLLVLALVGWGQLDPRAAAILARAVVASIAVVTLVGGVQRIAPELLSGLIPARVATGVHHAGLMGDKNAAAHAVMGQLGLVVLLVVDSVRKRRWLVAGGAAALLLVEIAYLASLQSRTAIWALAVSALVGVVLIAVRSLRAAVAAFAGAALLGGLVGLVAVQDSRFAPRWAAVGNLVQNPAAYLETDRGIYARNTLNIVAHHPGGVGVGNWQVAYPVYREHGRYVGFSDAMQVRRAHCDHLQILAELGVLGLVLWAALQVVLLGRLFLDWQRRGSPAALLLGLQILATNLAMATDYVLELPYGKLQLYLVIALALMHSGPSAPPHRRRLPAAMVTVVALIAIPLALAGLARAHQSSRMQVLFAAMVEDLQRIEAPGLRQGRFVAYRAAIGHAWDASRHTPGLSKTAHQDHLVVAQVLLFGGQLEEARAVLEAGLALHPYDPAFFGALAQVHSRQGDEAEAERYRRLYTFVMDEATRGFHPDGP